MSMILITINTGNAAFSKGDPMTGGCELARILRVMADDFEADGEANAPRDINGNVVGAVEVVE